MALDSYQSQYGQDRFIDRVVFKGLKKGTFLDIGAHDGESINNSVFFERYRDWSGICVEPNPNIYKLLVGNRRCECINACAGGDSGRVEFVSFSSDSRSWVSMLSGIREFMPQSDFDEASSMSDQVELAQIDVLEMTSLLSRFSNNKIHYVSIDTEGGELPILNAIDFGKTFIDVISVENNNDSGEVLNIMRNAGFVLVKLLGRDNVFINSRSEYLGLELKVWSFISYVQWWNRIYLKSFYKLLPESVRENFRGRGFDRLRSIFLGGRVNKQ